MRLFLSSLLLALAMRALPAAAAPCAPVPGICTSMQGSTCFINGSQCTIAPGATLDFGTKDVVFTNHAQLDVATGSMTLLAKSVTLQAGTALLGHGGSIVVQTTGDIAVMRSGTTRARIDVADPTSANRIELTATSGTISLDGTIDARGTNPDGSGGSIDVTGGNIVVSGDVLADGGVQGVGGAISLEAKVGNLTVSGNVNAYGGSGGLLDLTADGTITTTGTIDIRSNGAGNDGGLLTVLTNAGSITLGGKVYLQGDEGSDAEGGGNGGELDVFSGAGLTLAASFEVSGAPPDGEGGDVFFMSVADTVQTGLLQVQGRGAESDGGNVTFDSQKALTLGPLDVHGGDAFPDLGGGIEATSWCDLTVPTGVTIDALGGGGDIHLLAGGQLTATGALKAGGRVLLEYLSLPPVTAGGTFLPELDVQQNPVLIPCGGFVPPGCGNGTLDTGEQCDPPPGNTQSCDGCSSMCQIETCGNGTVDCGEACDDGNTADGDGCHGDCSRIERCGDGIKEQNEACDDGNVDACDGCSPTCQVEGCGNSIVECGEECEPPIVGGCSADCKTFIPPGCGNDVKAGQEECDDGNVVDGDGCSHQCRVERCGNGTLDPGEECDDFNVTACDGCSPQCKLEVCGNGVLDCGEECDDGPANGAPGGTCLPVCQPGPRCSCQRTKPEEPCLLVSEPCIPCATTADCDPIGVCGTSACESGVCTPVEMAKQLHCDDQNVCDGVETCDPAVGCRSGAPLDCDDHDACTTDTCDPATGCHSTAPIGTALFRCRLDTARGIVGGASGTDIAAAIRTKLLKKLAAVEGRVISADQAGGNTKKIRKALKAAGRQVQAVTRLVAKQRGKKITPATADALTDALDVLPPILTSITP